MPKKVLAAAIVTLIAALVTSPTGAASVKSPAVGSATAVNTILQVRLGSLSAKLGVDRADSMLSSEPYAAAGLDILDSDLQSISGAARDSRKGDPSGASAIGAGTKTLSGLASATVTTGNVTTFIDPANVSSSISFDVASADVLDGVTHLGTITTTTGTTVGETEASVTRSIEIGAVSVGSLRSLLRVLGVDPLALGCDGLEGAGDELGVDTDQGCEILQAIQTDIADAQAALESAKTVLESDLADATATVAGLTLLNPALLDLAARYGIDLTGSLLIPLSVEQRQALIDEISSRLDSVNDGIAGAAGETCATVGGALDQTSEDVPDLAATLDPPAASLGDGCAELAALLEDLLDVSVLSIDGIDISLNALAKPNDPAASALGEIGEIRVGNLVKAAVPLVLGADALVSVTQTVKDGVGDALNALGLGVFPVPTIEILDSSTSKGRQADGTWFAKAGVSTLHLGVPSTTLEGPVTDNLGVLAPSASASRSGPKRMAPVVSPALTVDVATFTGFATFKPATIAPPAPAPAPGLTDDTTDGATDGAAGRLPITGIPAPALYAGGMMLLGTAYGLRRFIVER